MSVFRSPLYLDTEVLVPLANYHDIEVMVDVAVTQRDLGQRSGKAALKATVPIPGSPGGELGGSKGSELEVTQARMVKDHPTNALNRLLDKLAADNDVTTNLCDGAIRRHQLVEVEGDWAISPTTDVGSLMAAIARMVAENPSMLQSATPPPEVVRLMTSSTVRGPAVLDTTLEDANSTHVLALIDSGLLVAPNTLDDIEGDRTVFGQVDTFVGEGSSYGLDKFFLAGFGRAFRRALPVDEMLEGMATAFGKKVTADDLKIDGPLVVLKVIAIY